MVLLEAWAHSKPVLMTPRCNLPEGFTCRAAFPILPQPDSLADGLKQLFHADRQTLQQMGARGHALVSARFAWPQLVSELKSVYRWLIGNGNAPKPDSVLTT
jgi:poly(glycerol-phosphate) alpha-glucosyltransferase